MAADTTAPSYWLNWRFLLCAICILVATLLSALIIRSYERRGKSRNQSSGNRRESSRVLYKGETWRTCLKSVHPIWLLAYRVFALCCLLALIVADCIEHSLHIFYFYTQWTFSLAIIYFALASSHSILGCLLYLKKADLETDHHANVDVEQNFNAEPRIGENGVHPTMDRSLNRRDNQQCRHASRWEYSLQIIFQMCAGAVALTDSVFWLVLYPFFTSTNHKLQFLNVSLHSFNAFFLLGDIMLNSLHFPFFRIAYFVLWTCTFVIFQWLLHVFVSMRWPYPFLNLSSSYSPIWYLAVGLLHLPCFGIFALIFKIKQFCLSKVKNRRKVNR